MSRYHTIPLNMGDFFNDTVGMEAVEIGAFISLVIAHYQIGPEGLFNDEKKLARMAHVTDKVWKRIRGRVLKDFEEVMLSGSVTETRWVNQRCIKVISKMEEQSAQKSANALKGWKSKDASAKRVRTSRYANQNPNITPYSPPSSQADSGSALRVEAHASPLPADLNPDMRKIVSALGEDFYRCWLVNAFLIDNAIYLENKFHCDKLKERHDGEIKRALGLENLEYRLLSELPNEPNQQVAERERHEEALP